MTVGTTLLYVLGFHQCMSMHAVVTDSICRYTVQIYVIGVHIQEFVRFSLLAFCRVLNS